MILNRLTQYRKKISYYQNGFRTNRGTIYDVHVSRQIIEQACEYNIQMDTLLIDFKQALIVFIDTKW